MKAYRVAHNTAFLTGAQITQKMLSFGYFWYLSNQLGKSSLGTYLFALSFATLFGSGTDLGLTPVLVRETARQPEQGNAYLRNVIGLKLILTFLAVAAAAIAITVSGKPVETRTLVYAAGGIVLLDAFTLSFWGIFKASRNLVYESIATIAVQLVIITGGIIVLQTSRSTLHLVLNLVLAAVVNFLFAVIFLRRRLGYRLLPKWDRSVLRMFLKFTPAFAMSLVFVKIYGVADTVLLGYLGNTVDIANYSIPTKVVTSLQQVIPAAFASVIYPVFTQCYQRGGAELSRLFERACLYLLGVSIPATVALVTLAPKILSTVWPAYTEVTYAFRLMALALPFIFLTFPTGYLLNACDRQRRTTFNRGVYVMLSVLGNLMLIPIAGYRGSAGIFLVTNAALLVFDGWAVRRLLHLNFRVLGIALAKIAIASVVMLALLLVLSNVLHLFVLIGVGAVAYVGLTYAMGFWKFMGLRLRGMGPSPSASSSNQL
ncbi:MAG: flippase [Patescibacteria group bacterium]|nr:flippase [Patescibacteria group bacterium]